MGGRQVAKASPLLVSFRLSPAADGNQISPRPFGKPKLFSLLLSLGFGNLLKRTSLREPGCAPQGRERPAAPVQEAHAAWEMTWRIEVASLGRKPKVFGTTWI